MGRVAVLTKPHRGRGACHYCGPRERGCSAGAYFSTQSSTLPAAKKTGNLTLVTDAVVERLRYDADSNRVTGVEVIDAGSGNRRAYSARMVFMCASTLASTQLLLNSRSKAFPRGLANSSGQLGHHLMDHGFVPTAMAVFQGFDDQYYNGNRPNAIYIPRFENLDGKNPDFKRGYGYQGMAWRGDWRRENQTQTFGRELKENLRSPGPWMMMLGAMTECLPQYSNHVKLDEFKRDKWGIPQLRISFRYGENEQKLADHANSEAVAMLEAAGGMVVHSSSALEPGGAAIHEMGTARMGRDPKTSVLNAHNQTHDIPNLFVTDGAAMASSACQNPSLTYMALTARACHYAVSQLAEGKI
jgi:choline dehydrogenase-like flavoprotein